MSESDPICGICRLPRSQHHEFQPPLTLPPGCKCNPREWRQTGEDGKPFVIPMPCPEYKPDETMPGQCVMCEHLEECHTPPAAPALAKAA